MRLGELRVDGDRLSERLDRLVETVGQGVGAAQLGQGTVVARVERQAMLELALRLVQVSESDVGRAEMQVDLGIPGVLSGDFLEFPEGRPVVLAVEGGDTIDASGQLAEPSGACVPSR